jgi:hypothetical protein
VVEHVGRQVGDLQARGPVGGRVDQRIHAPVRSLVRFDQGLDRIRVGHVRRHRLDDDPVGAQLLGRRRELALVAPGDRDRVPLLAQRAGQRLPDPARPAGDQPRPRRHGPEPIEA